MCFSLLLIVLSMLLYSLDVRHGNYAVWLRQAVFWIEEPVLRVAEGVNCIERLVFLAQEGDDLLRAQETELFEHRLMTRRDHPQYKPAQAILPIQRVLPAARIHVAEIVAHRVNPLTYFLGKYLVKGIKHISLPNILSKSPVVPEYVQFFDANRLCNAIINLPAFELPENLSYILRSKAA